MHFLSEMSKLIEIIKYNDNLKHSILENKNDYKFRLKNSAYLNSDSTVLQDNLKELIFEKIKNYQALVKDSNSLDEANEYFDCLEKIHTFLEIIFYGYEIDIGENLNDFLSEYIRLDTLFSRERIYRELKKEV